MLRHARTGGPFTAAELRERLGVDPLPALEQLASSGELLRGAFRPGGSSEEWVAPDVLRRVRRRTLATLRKQVEPVDVGALGRFLPAWHGIGRSLGRGPDRVREVVSQLGGVALPVAAWEEDVLPVRVEGYRPADLDALCAAGELVWIGDGKDRVALYLRDDAPLLAREPEPREHPVLDGARVLRCARSSATCTATLGGTERELLADLWELAWAGLVTNDSWQPLRAGGRPRPVPQPLVRRRARPTAVAARRAGPLVAGGRAAAAGRRRRASAPGRWPRRCSIATASSPARPSLAEGIPGGFSSVYGELRMMEEAGLCQRGYFVEGLGGAQFALPAAVERLRDVREPAAGGASAVLSALDPASPFGAVAPWPETARRPARSAGARVVLVEGRPALFVERGGRGILTLEPELLEPAIEQLVGLVRDGRVRRLAVERIDGEPIGGTDAERLLVAHGFLQAPRRVVLRA